MNNQLGKIGEDLATNYLKKNKYKIIEKNFRIQNGEIDIIAIDKKTLVFIEVKTRSSTIFGTPFEAITPRKINFITRTAEYYKSTHNDLPELLRIDAIAIIINPQENTNIIEHIENIN